MKKRMGIIVAGLIIAGVMAGFEMGRGFKDGVEQSVEAELKYKSVRWLNEALLDFQGPLGWVTILGQQADFGAPYYVQSGEDLLAKEASRQLFIMEYILQDEDYYSAFQMMPIENSLGESSNLPTSEGVEAYLPYETFDAVYKGFFDKDFNMEEAQTAIGQKIDFGKTMIYYDNRRAGLNGVRTESMTASNIIYDEALKCYTAQLTIDYSEQATKYLGQLAQKAILNYEVKDGKVVILSFKYC